MADGQATEAAALIQALRAQFGEAIGESRGRHEMPELDLAPAAVAEVCRWLKQEQGLNYLALLSGVDRLTHLDVVYFVSRMPEPPPYQRLILRVRLDRDEPHVPTVSSIWRAAEWQERELWDLLGIRFDGHPDPRRILLPEVWEGHPLRKDYRYDTGTMVEEILQDALGPDYHGRRS
jgi:NADH-quinone oxidoreductase subunit C